MECTALPCGFFSGKLKLNSLSLLIPNLTPTYLLCFAAFFHLLLITVAYLVLVLLLMFLFVKPRLLPNVLEIKGGLGLNNNNNNYYYYNSYQDWNRTKKTYPKFVFRAFSYSSVPMPVPTDNDNRIQDDDDDEYITLKSSDTKTSSSSSSSSNVAEDSLIPGPRLQQTICSLPPVIFLVIFFFCL